MSVRILKNVVETKLSTLGKGTHDDPVRVLIQYWDEDGNFLAERDTFPPTQLTALSESGGSHG